MSPICDALLSSTKFDHSVLSSIARLFGASAPFAIIGTIISAGFLAIKRHSLGSWTHIFQKILKALFLIKPSIAYFNALSAIIFVFSVIWGKASIFHCSEGIVFWGRKVFIVSGSTVSVLRESIAAAFRLKAAAGLLVARCKDCATGDQLLAAIAYTIPPTTRLFGFGLRNNKEARKSHSGEVSYFIHSGSNQAGLCGYSI